MLTRRLSSTTLLLGLGFTALLALAPACDDGDDGDDEAAEGNDSADSNSSNSSNDSADSNDTNSTNDSADSNDSGSDACADACASLESCGLPGGECLGFCTSDACAQCLLASESCGTDCLDACAPTSETTGDGDGDTTDTGPNIPPTECVLNSECGLGYECVACGLTDNEGWCEQTSECTFDDDCGIDGKCGYNVESSAYRCLPAEYCGG